MHVQSMRDIKVQKESENWMVSAEKVGVCIDKIQSPNPQPYFTNIDSVTKMKPKSKVYGLSSWLCLIDNAVGREDCIVRELWSIYATPDD